MVYKKVTTNREKQTNRVRHLGRAGEARAAASAMGYVSYETNIGSLVLSELYDSPCLLACLLACLHLFPSIQTVFN